MNSFDRYHSNDSARFAGASRLMKLSALVVLAGSTSALAQGTLVPIPPHSSTYNGFSRGYNFTANTTFMISRLELPPEAMQPGDTAGFLVRINGATAHYSVGNPTAYIDPFILVNTGDIVDIIGNWSPAVTGNFTAHNSYAVSGAINTDIEGVPHTLLRTGWQWDIADPGWTGASYLAPTAGQPGRIFMYTLPPSNDPGGCCFNDGSCQLLSPLDCANQGGVFRGPNTDCNDPCPQPGACCLPDGSCDSLLEAACTAGEGTWHGAGSTCGGVVCPQPGACCFGPLPCQVVSEAQCATLGGSYQGNATQCASCPPPPPGTFLLLGADSAVTVDSVRNALLSTGLITDAVPYPISTQTPALAELMQYDGVLTWTNLSYQDEFALGDVLADYVDAGGGVVVAVYAVSTTTVNRSIRGRWETGGYDIIPQRSANFTLATSLGVVHMPEHPIWQGVTGFAGATNYARATTFDLASHAVRIADWADGRVLAVASSQFPNRVDLNFFPGAWYVSPDAARVMANALVYTGLGAPNICYANCDGSTVEPVLNVDDFTCFINEFAAAQALPHSQQVTHYANCDGSTIAPALNVDDFTCFINEYAQGCP